MVYFIEIGIKYGILIIGRMPGTWLKLAVCAPLLNSYRDTLAVRAGEASLARRQAPGLSPVI